MPLSIPSFFSATPTPHIYTLSLHDALPISHHLVERDLCRRDAVLEHVERRVDVRAGVQALPHARDLPEAGAAAVRREDRKSTTSELQSRGHLVCRLLLEKKKNFAVEIVGLS